MIREFTTGDALTKERMNEIIREVNRNQTLLGDQTINVKQGPYGRTLGVNVDVLRSIGGGTPLLMTYSGHFSAWQTTFPGGDWIDLPISQPWYPPNFVTNPTSGLVAAYAGQVVGVSGTLMFLEAAVAAVTQFQAQVRVINQDTYVDAEAPIMEITSGTVVAGYPAMGWGEDNCPFGASGGTKTVVAAGDRMGIQVNNPTATSWYGDLHMQITVTLAWYGTESPFS